MKSKPWPTRTIPKAPVSAKTHGDPLWWGTEEWSAFHEWALILKDYPPKSRRRKEIAKLRKIAN